MEGVFANVSLLSKSGGVVAPSTLSANKVVGLYFSAHWCPPCRWARKSTICSQIVYVERC